MKIPLIKPFMNDAIKQRVMEVLESGYLTEGPQTRDFESIFKEYIGCSHSIAVTSCTTGLEIALRCLGIGEGDEVIVPDYTYPATASAPVIVGATTVIVDIDKDTMLIDYNAIEEAITDKTKAIIPVSEFGNPLNYEKLNAIKEKHGVYIVEDAACSIGAEYKNKKVGNQADISVFSLHPRKFITTGEGGMITTNRSDWAEWIRSFKHFGMNMNVDTREAVQFERVGTNSKMSSLLAALGYGQMIHVDELLENRKKAVQNYMSMLAGMEEIVIPKVTNEGNHSYQSFCIYVENRDEIMKALRAEGIEVQIGTYALHKHKAFQESANCILKESYPHSLYSFEHSLVLPLFNEISPEQQELVVSRLKKLLKA